MKQRQHLQNITTAYDEGRQLGFTALLERRNPTQEWFQKAGIYHARQLYKDKGALSRFMAGWMSNWSAQ